MNLRRKFLVTFGVLALLGLMVAGVSVWTTVQWAATNEQLREHYTRSLQADRIAAATYRAVKEVPDALAAEDQNARQEFQEAIEPAARDFDVWAGLADTEEERRQVREVREAGRGVVEDSEEVFDLIDQGRRDEARRVLEGPLEQGSFAAFESAIGEAIASDRERREEIRAQVEDTRRTAQLVLVIAAFGTVSLLLLLAAYLVSDLFRPLKEVENALDEVGRGDLNRRLDAERSDELGDVSRAFNEMVDSLSRRERMGGLASELADGAGEGEENGPAWRDAPSRVTLHRLVAQLRSRVAQLSQDETSHAAGEQRELISQLDDLSQAVARVTEFGFPLDLDLSRTDVRALLYRVFMRFQDEFAERAISLDLEIAPEVGHAVVDKLKLREAVAELLRNALEALPENGGHLGLRARISEDGTELLIEVADDGAGAEQSLIDRAFEPGSEAEGRPRTGLTLTRAVVEQHGGRFGIESEPGEGTYAQIRLPLRG